MHFRELFNMVVVRKFPKTCPNLCNYTGLMSEFVRCSTNFSRANL